MEERLLRTSLLLGASGIERLRNSRVVVFGLGGVGSFAAEALARSGIGQLVLVDKDVFDATNLNRQLAADQTTIGRPKAVVLAERIARIAPEIGLEARQMFYLPGMADAFLTSSVSYVVDAVDHVAAKIDLAVECAQRHIPLISSMGTGNKLDPTRFEVADIKKTSVCPLAKVMRRELKRRGIEKLKVVYSKEEPLVPLLRRADGKEERAPFPGSVAFVPPVAGLILAGEVIKDIAFGNLMR